MAIQARNTVEPFPLTGPLKHIAIVGATGAIGLSFLQQVHLQHPNCRISLFARNNKKLAEIITAFKKQASSKEVSVNGYSVDFESEQSIEQACLNIEIKTEIDMLFIATGWLHDETYSPEKNWQAIKPSALMKAYQINAIGPIHFVKTLFSRINLKHPLVIGILSARVGSISDNRMGGWYSYRASKAGLNMLIKTLAIEIDRKRLPICLVGLQPGTTDSALSKPFQKHIAADQLQTPEFTSQKLFNVLMHLQRQDSGKLFDFEGKEFAP